MLSSSITRLAQLISAACASRRKFHVFSLKKWGPQCGVRRGSFPFLMHPLASAVILAAGDFATSETFDKCVTAPACRSTSETTAVPEHGIIFFGRAISRPSGMSPQGSAEESN